MKTEKFEDYKKYPHYYELSEQHFEITGFRTLAEMAAYEKGQEHRETVLIGFIKDWDGSTNSIFGKILHDFIQSHKPKKPRKGESQEGLWDDFWGELIAEGFDTENCKRVQGKYTIKRK